MSGELYLRLSVALLGGRHGLPAARTRWHVEHRAAPGEAGVTAVAAGTKVGGGNHNGHPSIVGSGPAGGAARRAGRDQAGEPNPKSEARNPKQAPNRNT